MNVLFRLLFALLACLFFCGTFEESTAGQNESKEFAAFHNLMRTYCSECHTADLAEADIQLNLFDSTDAIRERTDLAKKTLDTLQWNQMPPADSPQLSDSDRQALVSFLSRILNEEAIRYSGDPGPIVLRRLNNAEYTNTIRDLTGIESLSPAKEFPLDGAAGEGFTNAGNALSMTPNMFTKYLDAARDLAQHAVLLPDGIRFSPSISRRDWTEETLAEIRSLYAKHSAKTGATQVNLQGVVFDTNDGGRLPFAVYLRAIHEERSRLEGGHKSMEQIARERGLSPKYLQMLSDALNAPKGLLMASVAASLTSSDPMAVEQTIQFIEDWQKALWKFSSVGHIGKLNGPKRWMEPIDPLSIGQEFRLAIPPAAPSSSSKKDDDIVLFLSTTSAGDGSEGDSVVWERPRFVSPGRPDLLLRDCQDLVPYLKEANANLLNHSKLALQAADWASRQTVPIVIADVAKKFQCEEAILQAWFDYLGIQSTGEIEVRGHLAERLEKVAGYEFVSGWSGANALSVIANSSAEHVRIPGNLAPHSLVVHPSPSVQMVIGWQSPTTGSISIKGAIQHAHPECGNGVQWTLQIRRKSSIQNLATGIAHGSSVQVLELPKPLLVSENDVICLVINPRNGDHSCDATSVKLTFQEVSATNVDSSGSPLRRWDLSEDVSPNILQGNPHQDSYGNSRVWHFFGEPISGASSPTIPPESLLANWQSSTDSLEREKIADRLSIALSIAGEDPNANTNSDIDLNDADRHLIQQLQSLAGPLMNFPLRRAMAEPSRFFKHSESSPDLSIATPGEPIEVRVPASLVAGTEFVTYGRLADPDHSPGSVQMDVSFSPPKAGGSLGPGGIRPGEWKEVSGQSTWTDGVNRTISSRPIIVSKSAKTTQTVRASFDEFRALFPIALCYNKIVPVDEVVTLTLYYREDDHLRRLMLSEPEIAELDRLWSELHFISRDALSLVDAYDQLWQYATQDADPSAFEPLRQPILDRAAAFRETLVRSEPNHLDAVCRFAAKAFRRPLDQEEEAKLRSSYESLRQSDLDHETSIRSLLTRIFVSPAFLYKSEKGIGETRQIAEGRIAIRKLSDWELATRLSYLITGTQPDDELRRLASQQALRDSTTLQEQATRLLQSEKAKSMATEFGCQWLQVYQFDDHDEKSPATFPEFAQLRDSMYQESILFWTDLMRNNKSVLLLLDADYSFVDDKLADHYGVNWEEAEPIDVPGFEGWRRVARSTSLDRGGVLTMASILSKQSGASRTSPILRGNWVSEVLLGEKLPRPPKNVPVLPEIAPAGLTERELIEMHSSNPGCAKCHDRIDPFGFAWEGFDAIGRRRDPVQYDTSTSLPDGTKLQGWTGLRDYLVETRKDEFLRQFCKKLLGFALGRAVQLSDQALIEEMMQALKENDYRSSVALFTILDSQQFQFIRTDDQRPIIGAVDEKDSN